MVLGDELKDGGGWVVRLYFNPLVRLIWIGASSWRSAARFSLTDRRLRIGAPRRARRRRTGARGVTGVMLHPCDVRLPGRRSAGPGVLSTLTQVPASVAASAGIRSVRR